MFNTSQNKGFNISTNSTDKNNNDRKSIRTFDDKYNNKYFINLNISNIKNNNDNNNNSGKNNYLKCRKWEYLNDDNELSIECAIKLITQKINKEKVDSIIDAIQKRDLSISSQNIFDQPSIGTLNSLNFLIEDTYNSCRAENEILLSDKTRLKPYVYKFRKIKKDGNCFFRGIIFLFLEHIILSKNIMLMKELLILFNEKISLDNPKIKNKEYIIENIKAVDKDIIIIILFIIIKYMDEDNIDKDDELTAYKILLKVYLNSPEFDLGMIFFTRYLLYEYISENENKILSKEIKVEIGNLLPDKYVLEKDGKYVYLFEDFYQELIKMGQSIDRIGAFVFPYVFNFNLNILEYTYGTEDNTIKEFVHKCGRYTNYELNLLFKDNYYDIYYKKYFYEKYYKDLDIFLENKEELSILKSNIDVNKGNNLGFSDNSFISKKKQMSIDSSQIFRNFNISKIDFNDDSDNNNAIKKNSTENAKRKYFINNNNPSINSTYYSGGSKCLDCKNVYNLANNDFGLCKNCKLILLKDQILAAYFNYLQKGYTKNCEQKLNNYISKIKIKTNAGKTIFLDTAIRNSGYTFKNLFNEIKETLCLYCGKNIEKNNYYFECPCKCKICKKECFIKYMDHVEDMNKVVLIDGKEDEMCIIPMTECPCGYKYTLQSFITVIDQLEKINEKSYIKIYEEQVKNNWKWICMVCKENFNKKNKYFRLLLSDSKMNQNILKKLELKHLICYTCYKNENIEKNNKIFCQFCVSKHLIDYVKIVNDDNKTESQCIII